MTKGKEKMFIVRKSYQL